MENPNISLKTAGELYDIAVIGGGPAGIMSAISAAGHNKNIMIAILEKNKSLGKKLLLTGNGRCNFTTGSNLNIIIDSFGRRGKFFVDAFTSFSNKDLVEFFKSGNILPAYEPDNKVFPANGNAATVLKFLENKLRQPGIEIIYDFKVSGIDRLFIDNDLTGKKKDMFRITSASGRQLYSRSIILATGGLSYPRTGSTGDGYRFAADLGHSIIPFSPSIIPVISNDLSSLGLQGISVKNANLSVTANKRTAWKGSGGIVFTHFGISGPAAQASGNIVFKEISCGLEVLCHLDLLPSLPEEVFLKNFEAARSLYPKKELHSIIKAIASDIPAELLLAIFKILKIDIHQKIGNALKKDILKIEGLIKNFTFRADGTLPVEEAFVTEGGISIKEINPQTMESRIAPDIYFAGEIIEIQGPEGGFNLQKAFSTGWLAGRNAASRS